MRLWAILILIFVLKVWAIAASSQTPEDDRSFIEGLIEDTVSSDDMIVRVINFEGALSSEATVGQITIADADGVWLELTDLTLQWNRSALLTGRVEIQKLAAEQINLVRLPAMQEDEAVELPSAEATPFALPDLPVSIEIEEVTATEIILTEALLGEPVTAQFNGALTLSGGAGDADIELVRTDAKTGRFDIDAAYDNETRQLTLFLLAEEGENGIAARMIDLPGRPAIRLEINGDAPLDDFAAQIALATDGVDRITGDVRLSTPTGTADQAFAADLSGDLQPLLPDEYDEFFGTNTVLQVDGTAFAAGGVRLSNLVIGTDQLVLRGATRLDAQGWPEAINVQGRLASTDGSPVILPVSGAATEVTSMTLNVQYDATESEDWTAAFDITSFRQGDIAIDSLALSGGGTITPGAGEARRGRFTAELDYAARGLDLGDEAINTALGADITGALSMARLEGEPFVIRALTINGAGIEAFVTALMKGPEDRFWTRAEIALDAQDFTRFSQLSGLDLSGGGTVTLSGDVQPFDGIFDLALDAETNGLGVGIDAVDPLIAGETTLDLQIERDTTGTRLNTLRLQNAALSAKGDATLSRQTADAQINARLNDLGLITTTLSGPAVLDLYVSTGVDGVIDLITSLAAPAASLHAEGSAVPIADGYQLEGVAEVAASDLAAYADLVGLPLNGTADLTLRGEFDTATGAALAIVEGQTSDLDPGIEPLGDLLRGDGSLFANVSRDAAGLLRLSELDIAFPNLSASGSAEIDGAEVRAQLSAVLADLGLVVPELSGPATLDTNIGTDAEGVITLDAQLDANDITASADGTAQPITGGYILRGDAEANVADLSRLRALVGQPLSGAVDLAVSGTFDTASGALQSTVSAQTTNLDPGIDPLGAILAGRGEVSANVSLSDAGRLRLDALSLDFPNLTVNGTVASSGTDTQATLSARLANIGLIVPDFSGPLTADVSATQDSAGWQVTGSADGPAEVNARTSGRIGNDGQLSLDVQGAVPLALANLYIAPRQVEGRASFDLRVDGPPALSSIRGPITISDGRLSAPTLAQAIENIGGTIQLAGGTARLDLRGLASAGGDLTVGGPVDLSAPFQAGLTVRFENLILRDPTLYQTTVNGEITISGPLTGGASISGALNLGETEVQVPTTGVSALGALPDVTHLGARSEVIDTLNRAGLTPSGQPAQATGGGGASVAFPLDLVINAPSRIFIRGRGLDAELGGQLRLTGTTDNVIPIGRFDLARGRLDILGQRFELDEGFAQLQGDFTPFIRLVATTEASTGTNVSIIVEGPADDIEVRFESSPELPQDEVLAQLLFGRDLSSISPLQAVQLASAVATLSGRGGGTINNIREGLDLDDLDITTDEDGNAAVRAGKYISDNVYTDVTVGVTGETEINLNIDIDRNFTARGTVASDGETSIGIFFERDY